MKKKRQAGIIYMTATVIVLLSVLSFLAILPPGGDFVLRVLSLGFLCFLLYRARLSSVLFGDDKRWASVLILVASFFLAARPLIETLLQPLKEGFLYVLFGALSISLNDINVYAIGTIVLAILSLIFTAKLHMRGPSVMAMLGEKGPVKGAESFVIRTGLTFFVLVAFYILVFDIALQWFSVLVGGAIMIGLLAGLFVAMKEQKTTHMTPRRFILFLDDLDDTYTNIVSLFHNKRTVLFGIAALLVVYPLSDLGVFIIPYVTNIPNNIFAQLAVLPGHVPLASLAYEAFANQGMATGIATSAVYLLNAIAAILALLLPVLFWYRIFTKRTLTMSSGASAWFVASVGCFLIAPAFALGRLSTTAAPFVGVDIMTRSLEGSPIMAALVVAIVLGVLTWLLAKRFTHAVSLVVIGASMAFVAHYMVLYFSDIWSEVLAAALQFFHMPHAFGLIAGFLFLSFLAIAALFYVSAIAVYFYEIWVSLWHEHRVQHSKI